MKIGVFGNNNNLNLQIVRYLHDLKVDAELVLLDNESPQFHPSCDSFDLSYQSFTRSVVWGSPEGFSFVPMSRVRDDLARYDQVWGCGALPAFMQKLGRRLDVFIPYGSDIIGLPRYPGLPLQRRWFKSFLELPFRQKLGIRWSRVLAMIHAPQIEGVVKEIGFRGIRAEVAVPLLYSPMYEDFASYRHASYWSSVFQQQREQADVLVFHQARHIWRPGNSPAGRKGNDKLLRGFARFCKEGKCRAKLITVEYGPDVNASKALIEELGIAEHVLWMPLLSRRDVMVGLGLSDIATGDFDVGWASGGVVFEAFAAGKPLFHYRDDKELSEKDRAPMVNVGSEEAIFNALTDYAKRPAEYQEIGRKGREWLRAHSGLEQVRQIAVAAGVRVPSA